MRLTRNFIGSVMLMWVVGACLKPPENSVTPHIELQSVDFKNEYLSTKNPDTLIITLKFTDGDGDLGINGDDTVIFVNSTEYVDINTPYYFAYDSSKNAVWYYTHGNNVRLPKGYKYVNYASYRTIHTLPFDTLPGGLTCKDWEYRAAPADTLYIQSNPYNNNIFVDLYMKNADGSYAYFDPTNIYPFGNLCVTNFFNGRFPVLSSDLGKKSSLEGTITYKIQSAALYIFLKGQTIKLKVSILDRAFHKSNLVESEDFVIH